MNVMITGATSGIGKATVEKLLTHNPKAKLWLIGRRSERLQQIKDQWPDRDIRFSALDVRDRQAVHNWSEHLQQEWDRVDLLVNNAGLALGTAAFQDGDMDDWDTMIDTNVKGLLYMTKAVLPLMIPYRAGHVINIGSTAGKVAYENGNVYCATKYAVDAIGQTLRIDLLPHGIKVTNVNPGMVETEFSLVRLKGDREKAKSVYNGFEVLRPEDVADVILYCTLLPPHVCVNDITVTCTQQANSYYKHASP